MGPELAAKAASEPVEVDTSCGKKRKRTQKQAFAGDPASPVETEKTAVTEVAAVKPDKGTWCTIHESSQHDLMDCKYIQGIIKSRKRRQMEGTYGNYFVCGEPGHRARTCPARGSGQDDRGAREERGNPVRPVAIPGNNQRRGTDIDGDLECNHGFQAVRDAACIHGGAYAIAYHGEVKRLSPPI
jgi:hypothetical protein